MAGAKEIGLGIASALGSEHAPDPFPMSFRGQTLEEAGNIVVAIISECVDAGIALDRIEMDEQLAQEVQSRGVGGAAILPNPDLPHHLRIYRGSRLAGTAAATRAAQIRVARRE